jgi:hypothetical protein
MVPLLWEIKKFPSIGRALIFPFSFTGAFITVKLKFNYLITICITILQILYYFLTQNICLKVK